MSLKVGDFVWAKMKGHPMWPAEIAKPNRKSPSYKSEKSHYCVYFFGTKDYAYIPKTKVQKHRNEMFRSLPFRMKKSYEEAIFEFKKCVQLRMKLEPHQSMKRKQERKKTKTPEDADDCKTASENEDKSSSSAEEERRNEISASSFMPWGALACGKTPDPALRDKRIGFIGVGDLAKVIIERLIEKGLSVMLCIEHIEEDLTSEDKVEIVCSPADLIVSCNVTFCLCDTDTDVFKKIVFGLNGMVEGFREADRLRQTEKGFVVLNSISEELSKMMSDTISLKYRGLYLEAPVISKGEEGEDCKMMVVASGDRKLFTECEKLCFSVFAEKSVFVSSEDINLSSKMKAIFNAFTGTMMAALDETFSLGSKMGIAESMFEVSKLKNNKNDPKGQVLDKLRRMSIKDFRPLNKLKHVQESLSHCSTSADHLCHSVPLAATANEVFKHAMLLGYSDSDEIAVALAARK